MSVVHVRYYTDPACPWSWALEPAVRRLQNEFDAGLRFTYVMCGMLGGRGDPLELVGEMLEASQNGMPVDPRLWLSGAPASSHPACIAVKAAGDQGQEARYLRRLREGFQCRRRKLDNGDSLLEEARVLGGLDLERFRIDLASHATLEAFGADLARAHNVPEEHQAPGTGRVVLPSLEFQGEGHQSAVYGYADHAALRDAALAAGAEPRPEAERARTVEEALRRFESMATVEVAAVCELPGPRAPAELWRLASEWRVRPERLGSGELWALA